MDSEFPSSRPTEREEGTAPFGSGPPKPAPSLNSSEALAASYTANRSTIPGIASTPTRDDEIRPRTPPYTSRDPVPRLVPLCLGEPLDPLPSALSRCSRRRQGPSSAGELDNPMLSMDAAYICLCLCLCDQAVILPEVRSVSWRAADATAAAPVTVPTAPAPAPAPAPSPRAAEVAEASEAADPWSMSSSTLCFASSCDAVILLAGNSSGSSTGSSSSSTIAISISWECPGPRLR